MDNEQPRPNRVLRVNGGVRRRRRPEINEEMIRLILLVFQATNAEMTRLLESIIGAPARSTTPLSVCHMEVPERFCTSKMVMASRFGTTTTIDADLRELTMCIDCQDIHNPPLSEIPLPKNFIADDAVLYARYLVMCVEATIEQVQRTRNDTEVQRKGMAKS